MRDHRERGAVAVEFAILAPVLIMLLLGIMGSSRLMVKRVPCLES
ncbi:TadE/TadG family type IV pilus assembly protein [Arthrobacter sp. 92]